MPRALTVRRLALGAALVALVTACGASSANLPTATPVIDSEFSIPGVDTNPPPGSLSTSPAPATATTGTGASEPSATTGIPATTDASWVNATAGLVGLQSECGNLSLLATRPDQDMLIASVAKQGLWSSTNETETWSKLGTGASSSVVTNRGSEIIFDPLSTTTFWESGTYHDGGLYRTDDAGASFVQLGNISNVDGFSIDLSDPARKTLLATIHENSQTFRSTDGGKSWTDITSALPSDIGFAIGPAVIDAQTFLLGSSRGSGSKVLRSTDGGATWTAVYDGGVTGRLLQANSDGTMYWLLEGGGLIGSIDNGQTWISIKLKTNVVPTVNLLELPDARLASLNLGSIIISSDHGTSWTPIGPPMPVDPSGLIYSPFRKAFYTWHFDCDFSTSDPIQPDSIMRLSLDPTTL